MSFICIDIYRLDKYKLLISLNNFYKLLCSFSKSEIFHTIIRFHERYKLKHENYKIIICHRNSYNRNA